MDLTIPRVLMWQFLVGLGLAAAIWAGFDGVAGYSALMGSLAAVIPNAFLALRLMLSRREEGARAVLGAAWMGEIGKLVLTVLIFTLIFTQVRPLNAAAVFAGFITTLLVTFSGFLMRHEQDTSNSNGS